MPRRAPQRCSNSYCRNRGPYSRRHRLCRVCGLKRMAEGGRAGTIESKAAAGRAGGRAGSTESKAEAGRAGSIASKAAAGRAGSIASKAAAGRAGSSETKAAAGRRSGLRRRCEMALMVKKRWLDLIFSGHKRWEIRSTATKRRGWIHLAQSKSGRLVGGAKLVNCMQIARSDFMKFQDLHCVPASNSITYKKIWAWALADACSYNVPFRYSHTSGAVIFVRARAPMGPPSSKGR